MLFEFAQRRYSARRRLKALIVSIILHIGAIAALIVIPLLLFQKLPETELLTFLRSPDLPLPPPPPLPPVPERRQEPQKVVVTTFTVPREIPRSIPPPDADNDAPPIDKNYLTSLARGIPGGVVGGSATGILGGVLARQVPPPPPPPPREDPPPPTVKAPAKPIFVGGEVQASKLTHSVPAVYPELALKAHVSGVVLLRITVDEKGKVADVKVLSGPPLLTAAAVQAVDQWTYSPTLLNGQPVQVIATIAVNFRLQ